MALTRTMLKAMGIEDDKAQEIINAHTETVDGLKKLAERYKEDAEKLPTVQKELDDLKVANSGDNSRDALQKKYDDLDKEFKDYKKTVEAEKTTAKIKDAYRDLLKETGVSEKRLDTVLKVADLSNVKLDKDGKITEAEKLKESIKTEWADFITTEGSKGADPASPPAGNPSNPGNTGRAKQLAAQYFNNLYGTKEEK